MPPKKKGDKVAEKVVLIGRYEGCFIVMFGIQVVSRISRGGVSKTLLQKVKCIDRE